MPGKQGLSHARNRGWKEAKGKYVGYIDDDAKAPPQWVSVAQKVIENMKPAAFGGGYRAYYDSPKPNWWKDEYRSHIPGKEARILEEDKYLSGGNLFFRLSLLQKLGGFDPNFGMTKIIMAVPMPTIATKTTRG